VKAHWALAGSLVATQPRPGDLNQVSLSLSLSLSLSFYVSLSRSLSLSRQHVLAWFGGTLVSEMDLEREGPWVQMLLVATQSRPSDLNQVSLSLFSPSMSISRWAHDGQRAAGVDSVTRVWWCGFDSVRECGATGVDSVVRVWGPSSPLSPAGATATRCVQRFYFVSGGWKHASNFYPTSSIPSHHPSTPTPLNPQA